MPTLDQTDLENIADAVWNALLRGDTYNVPTSAGRRLREITGTIITSGMVVTSTANTITLNGDAADFDDAYNPAIISITAGTGYGESRGILKYFGENRIAVVDRDWNIMPDNTSEYIITASTGREHVHEGLSRGQGSVPNSILLSEDASSDDQAYKGQTIFIRSGKGRDQACKINSYNGTTKEAVTTKVWPDTPDETSAYVVLPTGMVSDDFIARSVLDRDLNLHTIEDSVGKKLQEMASDLEIVRNVEEGNWKIQNNQMIFYNTSGQEMFRFNLFDNNANPNSVNVFERRKV
jgi:hypothetical protein